MDYQFKFRYAISQGKVQEEFDHEFQTFSCHASGDYSGVRDSDRDIIGSTSSVADLSYEIRQSISKKVGRGMSQVDADVATSS